MCAISDAANAGGSSLLEYERNVVTFPIRWLDGITAAVW
jgi:hypothetical protein